jgi:serine protease Do
MKKIVLITSIVAVMSSALTVLFLQFSGVLHNQKVQVEHIASTPSQAANYTPSAGEVAGLPSFTETAKRVIPAVVYIKSTQAFNQDERRPEAVLPDPFRDFFGDRFRFEAPQQQQRPRVGTGSGVIINPDGYIVTNNHVIDNASDIEVTLNDNRTYKATVIGTDPSTDLALIRIKENGLPSLPFVNSDEVGIGEWVLAVGNPFSLNSTVTAGIVSAKARNINILREQYAVESFIQTDAAINPGNSGGALVNLEGGLVGINTAIASPTGAYSGYGFAVPANIVSKVIEDLMEYGAVQRGVLGVMIRSIDGNFAKAEGLSVNNGAYVDSLLANSAAAAAGIRAGDVIVAVDGSEINSSPALQEQIARHRPGDEVAVTVNRNGKEKTFNVTLNNRQGSTEIATVDNKEVFRRLGAEFENLSADQAEELDLRGGVVVKRLYPGKLRQETQIREGFVITKVNGQSVRNVKDLSNVLENLRGGVMLEGVYPDQPGTRYYAFGLEQ